MNGAPTPRARDFRRLIRLVLLSWALLALTWLLVGCGGGDADDEDQRQHIPTPPACGASAVRCL